MLCNKVHEECREVSEDACGVMLCSVQYLTSCTRGTLISNLILLTVLEGFIMQERILHVKWDWAQQLIAMN